MRATIFALALLPLTITALGCEDRPTTLAPTSSVLAPVKPATTASQGLAVETASSNASFEMEAPLEKILGRLPESMTGEVHVDLQDISKSSGVVRVNLDKLNIYQRAREQADGEYGEEKRQDLQNQHARNWLEIGGDVPQDQLALNRIVEFRIAKIEPLGQRDVSVLAGAERTLKFRVTGDFRLHQRVSVRSAEVEAVFKYEGDKLTSVHVKTVAPFKVGLEEHDVKPREAFGKLAAKTLSALSPKVAKEASISLDFVLSPK